MNNTIEKRLRLMDAKLTAILEILERIRPVIYENGEMLDYLTNYEFDFGSAEEPETKDE